ncbi:MAG: hypothetical protein A2V88_06970 [Elusimicrobia bacterium RBG_16_66_12]|nr:MAG: hypothetical protein A2V88_06970 [Elusimicrobia bacterium RBG_16_66_12]
MRRIQRKCGMILPALLVAASATAAEPLADRVERDYVRPALEQVRGTLEGREPAWTPPALPGTASSRRLSMELSARWLEPLLQGGGGYVGAAARHLASPTAFEAPPEEPSLAERLPLSSLSPAAAELVETVERRFLSKLFPEEYFQAAARSLGSAGQDEGPAAPDLGALPQRQEDSPARLARPGDFSFKLPAGPAKDSTRMIRGKAGSPAQRLRLKPLKSRFSPRP